MQIVKINELVYAEPWPASPEERDEKRNRILADLGTPIYMGTCTAVTYDHKSDRYSVTGDVGNKKKLVLKAANDVAAFMAAHMSEVGYWQGRMEYGTLVEVNLIQAG